jgi:hypothetical protein
MRNGAPPVVSLPAIHCLRGIPGADVGHPPWKKINLKKVKASLATRVGAGKVPKVYHNVV